MMHSPATPRRGAALLIAVAILAILSVFAVVFSIQSRVDMDSATNFSNNIRADLMADAGTAIAIAFLDHNRDIYPTVTSLDQAAFTYFNGTWIGGKWWAFNEPSDPARLTWVDSRENIPFIRAIEADALGEALYIPRYSPAGREVSAEPDWDPSDSDNVFNPIEQAFLIRDPDLVAGPDGVVETRTRAEQLHQLTVNALFSDVDNDGDGYRDSMWIPIPADRIFGGLDIDGDGEFDGIDNDGDGTTDEAGETNVSVDEGGDGIDNDLDGIVDEAGEMAPFVYWGGNDGFDNDGDLVIDEIDEQRIFLTAPLAVTNIENANFGDNLLNDGFLVSVNIPVLLEYADAPATSSFAVNWQTIEQNIDIDVLDNDFDFIADNGAGDVFDAPTIDLTGDGVVDFFDFQLVARRLGLNLINTDSTDPASYSISYPFGVDTLIAARGEPVCTIAGRVAVLINDEASKVNIDIAGANSPNEHFRSLDRFSLDARRPVRRALSQGIGPFEYDLRVLPGIGNVLASRMWDYRTGITNGGGLFTGDITNNPGNKIPSPINLDLSLPGYGGVDDNMSSLWMAVNGIDDDGDAEIYQNDDKDNDLNGLIDEPGEGALVGIDEGLRPYDYDGDGLTEYANFEGTDEPGELQLFHPLRNLVLEDAVGDEDEDNSFEEFGEASDRVYHARDQLLDLTGIASVTYERMRNLVTAHSLDGGGRYRYLSRENGQPLERPVLNGLKLNLNYAMAVNPNNADDPGQIARMLIEDWYYPPAFADAQVEDVRGAVNELNFGSADLLDLEPYYFLAGLRQEDVGIIGVPYFVSPTSIGTVAGNFGTFPPDQELRALRLGATLQDFRDRDHVRTESSIRVEDPWWNENFVPGAVVDDNTGDGVPDFIRQIEYKTSGIESIRINEIMVRPVRRIEVEGTPGSGDELDPNQFLAGEFDYDFTPGSLNWVQAGNIGAIGEDTVLSNPTTGGGEIAQFTFRPSVGLPPGRYYLTVNITTENGTVSVPSSSAGDIEYAIKYVASSDGLWPGDASVAAQRSHGDTDIITDEGGIAVPWTPLSVSDYQVLPLLPVARDSGLIFLGTEASPVAQVPPFEGYGQGSAFTVEIPPFQGGPNGEQVELVVALRRVAGAGGFSINYFEFSQDPDHEYLEIVNIEEPPANLNADNIDIHAIDLSGWEVEVGDSNTDSNAVIMRIPNGTRIAPGDTLVLAVNKFDGGIDGNGLTLFDDPNLDAVADIFKNGIGLARGPRIPVASGNPLELTYGFGWVTEPPMPRIDDIATAANGYNTPQNYTPINDANPPTATLVGASVFYRPVDRETTDFDGNGNDDYGAAGPEPLPNFSLSTPVAEPTFGTYSPTAFGAIGQDDTNPAKAWDRIVQLEIANDDVLFASESKDEIAALVLRGGVFPNYPELDGVDNDGDDGYLSNDRIDNDGDSDPDGAFDADNDGLFDDEELPAVINGVDEDHDGFIDELPLEGHGVDEPFEGYDEGYVRRYIRGETGLPVGPVPGSYDDEILFFTNISSNDPVNSQPDYMSNAAESPDWKALVERRFYPGDNVIVTLYDGPVGGGRVVDSVTYNQRDVENVAIDDNVDVPAGLVFNPALPQAWPPNTMGLDFYRSLERKHPLYAGDRYGTRNRWTATDGNYDDWSRGTNRFDPLIVGVSPTYMATDENDSQFTHGLSGSPLRMNFYQRVLENAGDQFAAAQAVVPLATPSTQWMYDRAKVRNRNVASAGDLMTLAHMSFAHNIYETSTAGVFDVAFEATPFKNDTLAVLNAANGIAPGPLVGMDFPKDLQALMTSTSFDEVNLSVGQADFYPLFPAPGDVDLISGDPTLAQWSEPGGIPRAPRAWSPVFLYPLGSELVDFDDVIAPAPTTALVAANPATSIAELFSHLFLPGTQDYPFYPYYMFQPAVDIGKVPAGTTDGDMEDRWPLDRRAVTYVSANPQDFNPNFYSHNEPTPAALNNAHPSEALFVWQGEDALQNGRYDVYVVTMDNLDQVAAAHLDAEDAGGALLTTVGEAVVGAQFLLNPEDFAVDIEFFSDLNGDRRCWDDSLVPNGIPNMVTGSGFSELENDLNSTDPNPESFGRLDGMVPSREGIIHYGAVEVKNNYLAMFIRNWASSGATNRVTRVVLTPRRATSGRINLNTAVIRPIDTGELFNPLYGIPGMMLEEQLPATNPRYFKFADNDEAIGLPNALNQPLAAAVAGMSIRSEAILNGRQDRGVYTNYYSNGKREFVTPFSLLDSRNQASSFTAQQMQYPLSLYFGNVPALALTATDGEERFNEMQKRMSLMSNFVTTRSDVFEIVVTAQSGYVADNNGDGILNWRDDTEFVSTGEIKRRVIYERSQGDPDAARQ